jgi:hypothetical protein
MKIPYGCNSLDISPLPLRERGRGRGGEAERESVFAEGLKDRLKHRFNVQQYLVVPEAQHCKALVLQPCVTPYIAGAAIVLPSIGFDDQARTEVHEVNDIRPDGLLPAEFLSVQTMGAEVMPEQSLRVGHVLA